MISYYDFKYVHITIIIKGVLLLTLLSKNYLAYLNYNANVLNISKKRGIIDMSSFKIQVKW